MIRYDPMTAQDYPEVLKLWRNTEGVGLNESDEFEPIRAFLRRNPGMSQVARHEQTLVGAVLCGHDGRRGYLHHLAVVPRFRGQGIGRALVQRCLASLEAVGIPKCNIFLFNNNQLGAAFWQRTGWQQREDLLVAQKKLGQDTSN
jgi:ribosomal protein S18 acetylase RimI-like enzyme